MWRTGGRISRRVRDRGIESAREREVSKGERER